MHGGIEVDKVAGRGGADRVVGTTCENNTLNMSRNLEKVGSVIDGRVDVVSKGDVHTARTFTPKTTETRLVENQKHGGGGQRGFVRQRIEFPLSA